MRNVFSEEAELTAANSIISFFFTLLSFSIVFRHHELSSRNKEV
jgi:hypothetical protein